MVWNRKARHFFGTRVSRPLSCLILILTILQFFKTLQPRQHLEHMASLRPDGAGRRLDEVLQLERADGYWY